MKRLLLFYIGVIAWQVSFPQWSTSGSNIYNTNSGSVGIGTSTPATNVEIKFPINGGLSPILRLTGGGNAQVALDLATYDPGGSAPAGRILAADDGNYSASIVFQTKAPGSNSNTLQTRLQIMDNGNVGIGTTNTQGYLLAVNGSAIFTSARVKAYYNWPDFVFGQGYRLPPLDSVAHFIQTHHHLPDLPSADSVQATGIDLGGTDAALLKKIEELTLYMIEQKKEVDALKEEVSQLKESLARKTKH